ncbi:hypothetical protein BH10PSE6_BH10PSE6_18670 [soil metagenome]
MPRQAAANFAAFFNRLAKIGATGSAADLGRLMDAEGAKRASAVKASGVALE